MSRPIAERITSRLRWVASLPRDRSLVLLYHRVADLPVDPWGLAVPPDRFREHLQVIRQWDVLALPDLVAGLEQKRVPHGAIAVTFDDGYADNLLAAQPLLAQAGVPATIYIATAALDDPRIFWWDELARLMLELPLVQSQLELSLGAQHVTLDFGAEATCPPALDPVIRRWRVWEPVSSLRQRAYVDLWELLSASGRELRQRTLDTLQALKGRADAEALRDRPLTVEQLARLATSPEIVIGAHTMTHPRLSTLDAAAQRKEITGSLKVLADCTGHAMEHFAYPFGGPLDFNSDSVRLVEQAGLRSAATVGEGSVLNGTNAYRIPRLYVQDWTPEELDRLISRAIGQPRQRSRGASTPVPSRSS